MTKENKNPVKIRIEDESQEVIPFKYSITSYGADYPVDGLVKRMQEGNIYIPSFQRGFVWTLKDASRFIESLLLGLPVPGIFLSKEEETQKLIVIDGQQRLRTLQYFYIGIFADTGREFALRGVQSEFEDKTYRTLQDEDRRRLDDSILHATIVKQDEPSDDQSSIFLIFERLNTGGSLLQPQEIRLCIYQGEFNDLLKKLNDNEAWRSIFGPYNPRMRDRELILRFLALYFVGDGYSKPMKQFLNIYMGKNRHLKLQSANQITKTFTDTIGTVQKYLGNKVFKPKGALNAAIFDAVMVGVAKRLERGVIHDQETFRQQYNHLLQNKDFEIATERATTNEQNVSSRIDLAIEAFAKVK